MRCAHSAEEGKSELNSSNSPVRGTKTMKILQRFALGLFAASLFFNGAARMFAAGPQNERAGYQGIPVRNGLNRGLIQYDDNSLLQRYPRLPRRTTEADLSPAFVDGLQSPSQGNQDRGGYGGIPHHSSSAGQSHHDENLGAEVVQHPGYRGIPQPAAADHQARKGNSTLATRRVSGFVVAK
ncbi:MAG: hypothetical protein DMG64_16000 [Acidobacteria bacterium]|nr:MAG: hypothetical protein DMG63_16170 [Acidobacteriota bacterium]PYY00855.1 MAG: hypothetical protein DMG64_16000 [Acidobacteriota bacterium]PYY24263.1 MAG: hypothetical protein DMG62_04460 [Acidobacteriota bacterium]